MPPETSIQKAPKASPSTVGRARPKNLATTGKLSEWQDELVSVSQGDSLSRYDSWPTPTTIVSDGGYGVLGFDGDTSDHLGLPDWYESHIAAWARNATPATTLWFWNSEIGWAAVHPILEKHGWRYVNANLWNKGKGHIAGNVNTAKIRRFPVVTEICVQYTREARIDELPLKQWLKSEWSRTRLPQREANTACGVKDAAVRKYLDQGHLWYFPPPAMFEKLARHANEYGAPEGRPYFSANGKTPLTAGEWALMRSKFNCPHGFTNVWERGALRGKERVKIEGGKAVHLNQKPLDLIKLIIEATTDPGDIVWEPFGGLFTACSAARELGRKAVGCELDPTYFNHGVDRLRRDASQLTLIS